VIPHLRKHPFDGKTHPGGLNFLDPFWPRPSAQLFSSFGFAGVNFSGGREPTGVEIDRIKEVVVV